ncbi:unnamed protein product [Calypogeia fissa]
MVAEDLEEEEAPHEDHNQHLACEGVVGQDLAHESVIQDSTCQEFNQDSLSGSSWLREVRDGVALIRNIDVDDDSTSGWSSPPGYFFQVRGEDYLTSKMKVPGGDTLLQPVAFDWIKSSNGRIDAVLQDSHNRITKAINNGCLTKDQVIWAFNVQVPSSEHYSFIAYYISSSPHCESSLIDRFVQGNDEFKNSRLKLIASIVKGPWAVKSAVGDHAICLLGRSLTCRYIQGERFIEVDVDLGSSIVANAIVHLAITYVKTLTVDLAFLIEGRTKEELPEKILGTIRFSHLDLDAATPVEAISNLNVMTVDSSKTKAGWGVSEDRGEQEVKKLGAFGRVEEAFQSSFWKSLAQGLSLDWWGRQEL